MSGLAVGLLLLSVTAPSTQRLGAQDDRTVSTTSKKSGGAIKRSETASIAEASPDTGRMLPAHSEWARYRKSGMCLAALRNIQHVNTRALLDTVVDSTNMQLTAEARARTLECASPLDLEQLDRDDLWAALHIALSVGNDSQAIHIVDRQMQLSANRSALERAEIVRRAIEYASVSLSPRERVIRELLPRLSEFGDSARSTRMLTYLSLVDFYANTLGNGKAGRQFADSAVALHRELTPYDMHLGLLSTRHIQREAAGVLLKGADPEELLSFFSSDTASANDPFVTEFTHAYRQKYVEPIGKPVPGQLVSYLYQKDANSAITNATVVPKPGVFSLWVVPPNDWRTDSKSMRIFAAMLRQIQTKYGRNTDMTLFVKTAGYLPGTGPLSIGNEVDGIRKYFWDTHKLRVNLAIAESPMEERPDGRRVFGTVGFDELFGAGFNYSQLIVTDQKGNCLRRIDAVAPGISFDNKLVDALRETNR